MQRQLLQEALSICISQEKPVKSTPRRPRYKSRVTRTLHSKRKAVNASTLEVQPLCKTSTIPKDPNPKPLKPLPHRQISFRYPEIEKEDKVDFHVEWGIPREHILDCIRLSVLPSSWSL